MTPPLPPEREGKSAQREGEGLSRVREDKAYDPLPTTRSRDLRNNSTDAERKLWNALSRNQLGVRFNRQVVIRPYICDFVARSLKLVIELDGGQHAVNATRDQARTRFLKSKGYRVIRFWNHDVLLNIEGVVETIMQVIGNMPSPARLRRVAPSRSGGRGVFTPPAGVGGEEARSAEGESLSSSEGTSPPPLAFGESTPPALAGGEL